MAFDRWIDVDGVWRRPLPALTVVLLAGMVLRLIWRGLRRPDYDAIAHRLDRASGDPRDHLRSVLDFAAKEEASGYFITASGRAAVDRWHRQRPAAYARDPAAQRLAAGAVALAVLLAVLWHVPAVRADLLWRRFLDPLGNTMRPTATWLAIEPPGADPLRSGDDLTVRATIEGLPAADPVPLLKATFPNGVSVTRRLEAAADGRWHVVLANLKSDVEWFVLMGAGEASATIPASCRVPR